MPPSRRRKRAETPESASDEGKSQYKSKKAARERHQLVRQRIADFVKHTIDPGFQTIADEFDIPVSDVRELAHLAMPALAKQRRYSLWQTVVSAFGEDAGDLKQGSRVASETYARIKTAIEDEDWDNDELVMYEALRDELEAKRSIPKMPATIQRSTVASIAEVTRCGKQIADMLHTLHEHAEVEFCVLICSGKSHVKFPPQVYHTDCATDFFKFKAGLDCDRLAEEMQGYALYGAQVYKQLSPKDPRHRSQVSNLLTEQLRKLTGKENVKMKWKNYDELCDEEDVHLVGWPADITMKPMERMALSQARRLHELIRAGKLRFERKATATAAGGKGGAEAKSRNLS